ncbi:MAG: hypothetical protein PVJ67_05905 [Candidatus Pacearchaeota archaeon]|jgi:hypothetical protein
MTEKRRRFDPVTYGLEILRDEHGFDMSAAQLSKYLDKNNIDFQIAKIQASSKFKKIKTNEEKTKFLYSEIIKYIVDNKPFDERGQRLLEGNLESIVGKESFWQRVFSSQEKRDARREGAKKDYRKSKRTAEELSYAVAENSELYVKEAPELVEAVGEFGQYSGRGNLAEILYASGDLAKETYHKIKSATKGSSEKILKLARKYAESLAPATSYATAIFGIVLIFLFNPITSTGSIIGVRGFSNNSIFSFVGIALLFISGLSFIFRGKKLKK